MNFGQLTEFPFNAQVWGTVSDWLMVFVTAVTAWFLIRTFREQQRFTKIEEYRHIENIKPKFELGYEPKESTSKNDPKLFNFSFAVKNHDAINVEIKSSVRFIANDKYAFPAVESRVPVGETMNFLFLTASDYRFRSAPNEYFLDVEFIISYQDIDCNAYLQSIQVVDNSGVNFHVFDRPAMRVQSKK